MIYLDNSATTPVRPEVREYIYKLMGEDFGNPSALYDLGIRSEKVLTKSRKTLAKILGCRDDEIYFTASGSEANNLAIKGITAAYAKRGRHIITTAVEHPSVLRAVEFLSKNGWEVTYLPVDTEGNISLELLARALRKDTVLVAMMMVNNEVGTIFPIVSAAKLVKEKVPDCHFHVDGVQAFGRLPIDLSELKADTLSLSGHKIGAPKGIGAIYVKKGLRLEPLIHGGGQENGMRAGTENFYYVGALALAGEISVKDRERKNQYLKTVKLALLEALKDEGVEYRINGDSGEGSVPYILNLEFPGVTGEVLLHYLEEQGIYVSQGSACHSRTKGSSETLMAMGRNDEERNSALRFSFNDETKAEDMTVVAKAVKAGADMIREMRGGK
ncbi:MAG: cysteine desulfurase family protein [Bacillota bacterium]|nr:cysteine desulfurase family protein [Bacillota bacterium]